MYIHASLFGRVLDTELWSKHIDTEKGFWDTLVRWRRYGAGHGGG